MTHFDEFCVYIMRTERMKLFSILTFLKTRYHEKIMIVPVRIESPGRPEVNDETMIDEQLADEKGFDAACDAT